MPQTGNKKTNNVKQYCSAYFFCCSARKMAYDKKKLLLSLQQSIRNFVDDVMSFNHRVIVRGHESINFLISSPARYLEKIFLLISRNSYYFLLM